MTRNVHVIPGGLAARQAKVGIVVFVLFLLFGLVFGFIVLKETPDSESGQKLLMGAFFLIWVVVCISIIVMFKGILSKQKNPQEKSLVDLNLEEPRGSVPTESGDFESRLRQLENLKRDGLVTQREYQVKRAQILSEKW